MDYADTGLAEKDARPVSARTWSDIPESWAPVLIEESREFLKCKAVGAANKLRNITGVYTERHGLAAPLFHALTFVVSEDRTLEYLERTLEAPPHLGLGDLFAPPSFAQSSVDTFPSVREAIIKVGNEIEVNEPYDGVSLIQEKML